MSDRYYDLYSCTDSASQEVVRVVAQKISSALSIMGSSHILMTVWGKWRRAKSSVDSYHRIMVGFSIFDILFSFFYWFLGTWMTPSETGWWGAIGNNKTCSMQGFFSTLLYGSAMYQMALSLQMLLLVSFLWRPNQFRVLLERKIHVFIIISTIAIALIPLFFDGYNPKCGTCLPVPTPYWCGDWVLGDGSTECEQGNATVADIFQYLHWCFISFTTLFCSGSMLSIYLSVYFNEKKMKKYRFSDDHEFHGEGNGNSNGHSESKRLRKAMILYSSSFYICWIIPLILWYAPHSAPSLHIVGDVMFALLGFFNMLVFTYPRCVKYQKEHPGMNLCTCYIYVLFNNQIKRAMIKFGKGDPTAIDCTNIDDVGIASSWFHNDTEETFDSQNNRCRTPVSVPAGAGEARPTKVTWADKEADAPPDGLDHTEGAELDVSSDTTCGPLALVEQEEEEAPSAGPDNTEDIEVGDAQPAAASGPPLVSIDKEVNFRSIGLYHTEDAEVDDGPPVEACEPQVATLVDKEAEAPSARLDNTEGVKIDGDLSAATCGVSSVSTDEPCNLQCSNEERSDDNRYLSFLAFLESNDSEGYVLYKYTGEYLKISRPQRR